MLLIRGLHNLRPGHRHCVATIGNFDGVHIGHQSVFEALTARARAAGLPSLVIIFEPQPLEFFQPDKAPARLTRLREKIGAIAACGVDRILLIRFDAAFAAVGAEEFVDSILVDRLGVEHLYVGDDFRFGKGRTGDFAMLERMGAKHGFAVESLATVAGDGERISSTRIREAMREGKLRAAERWLGRRYCIVGRVAYGHQRGRTIGFPTLNISLLRRAAPLRGVYAVDVREIEERPLAGVANIGTRPTVDGDDRLLLEVHLFDYEGDLYGHRVEVGFIERIRDERKFDSFDALREQIEKDSQRAREIHRIDAQMRQHSG